MSTLNTQVGYGAFTKFFHWLIVILFSLQYAGANIMTRIEWEERFAGLSQADYYNWHKSLGLIALVIAVLRLVNRQLGRLPDWAVTLNDGEKRLIHRYEQVLYLGMFIMPVSGYFYVMAGGYGVEMFGIWTLPNPIGKWESLAVICKYVHIFASYLLFAAIFAHLWIVFRHQFIVKDRLIRRMLPNPKVPERKVSEPRRPPGEGQDASRKAPKDKTR